MSRKQKWRWALMGEHPLIATIADRLIADDRFVLAYGVRTSQLQKHDGTNIATARFSDHWDELTGDSELDFIVVASDQTEMLEGAKLLATMGRTLAILPLAELGTSWIHELSLVRDDETATLVTLWPLREHPGVMQLKQRLAGGEIGRILEVQFQRTVRKPASQGVPGLIPPRELDDLFLHDADVICYLVGEPTHLTSVTLGHIEGAVSRALTTIGLGHDVAASWSVSTGETADSWQLIVRGESGSIELKGDANGQSAVLSVGENTTTYSTEQIDEKIGARLTDVILHDAVGRPVEAASPTVPKPQSEWATTLRIFEMLDASHRSRRRRRTIDLLGETPSERSQFKAQMAAVGCGLLMATFMGVLGLLLLGAFVDAPSPHVKLAEQHGTLFREHEFVDDAVPLTDAGEDHFKQVLSKMRQQRWPLVIEVRQDEGARRLLQDQRRSQFVERLTAAEIPQPDGRVFLEPVKSPWLRTLLAWGRVLVFLPLFVFLALQGLFVLTRPSAEDR
ncbi:MAG: hypothetical protein O2955_01940 [Planctomycetota bacterium]|nr:hypothetical protein [Planctomycetota bacterium]MDA1211244.1 hypothetical protein [Planctomycetota bacterium]